MFYDLNIPYSPNDRELPRTLAFAAELGYNVIALNHTLTKLPAEPTCAIPEPLPFANDLPKGLTIMRRVTLLLTEPVQNARLAALAKQYDMLAVRPVDEKTLQLACTSLDCEIVSLDLTQRLGFFFKFKMLGEAVRAGKKLELCYGQAVLGDPAARRNLISNATQLVRATRGRGLLLSSEAHRAAALRGPWDAINLLVLWGLGQERGYEAVTKDAKAVVAVARLKRTSYRGVIDVVYGGEKPLPAERAQGKSKHAAVPASGKPAQKRKADAMSSGDAPATSDAVDVADKALSRRELKRRAKKAKLEAALGDTAGSLKATADPSSSIRNDE